MGLSTYYLAALAVRLFFGLVEDSFIHPDEHFQCGEVGAKIHLGLNTNLPWEYEPGHAARSYLPVEIMCGIPMEILKMAHEYFNIELSGSNLRLSLRLWMFFLSIFSDATFALAAKRLTSKWRQALVLRSISWAMLVLFLRPFSNVLETIVWDCLLATLVALNGWKLRATIGGLLIAIGCFVRITFPAFASPLVIEAISREAYNTWKKTDSRSKVVTQIISFSALAGTSVVLFCSLILMLDWQRNGAFVIAPWNNIVYNTDRDNLAKHGLHPWWTHAVVNMQILFGILPLLLVVQLIRGRSFRSFLLASIVVPLAVLSAFPHQEFRFLLPLISPLTLLVIDVLPSSKLVIAVQLLFNLVLTMFFSFLHQGGLNAALARLSQLCNGKESCCVLACNVYSLPKYLLGSTGDPIRIFQGSDARDFGMCKHVFVLEPQTVQCEDPGYRKLFWTHEGVHWSGEAGGIVPLAISSFFAK